MDNKEITCPICEKGVITRGINTCNNPECNKSFSKIDLAKISKGTYKKPENRPNNPVSDNNEVNSNKVKTVQNTPHNAKNSVTETSGSINDTSKVKKDVPEVQKASADIFKQNETPKENGNIKRMTNREILNQNTRHSVVKPIVEEPVIEEPKKEDNEVKSKERFVSKLSSNPNPSSSINSTGSKKVVFTSIGTSTKNMSGQAEQDMTQVTDASIENTVETEHKESSEEQATIETEIQVNEAGEESIEIELDIDSVSSIANEENLCENEYDEEEVNIAPERSLPDEDNLSFNSTFIDKAHKLLRIIFVDGISFKGKEKGSTLSRTNKGTKSEIVNDVDYDFNSDGYYDDVALYDSTEPIYFSKKKALQIIGYFAAFIIGTIWLIYMPIQ